VDDDPPEAAQLTGLGEGEGTGRDGRKCGLRRREDWGTGWSQSQAAAGGVRIHDSLGDGGDGLNRGGCGFEFGRKQKRSRGSGLWAFS